MVSSVPSAQQQGVKSFRCEDKKLTPLSLNQSGPQQSEALMQFASILSKKFIFLLFICCLCLFVSCARGPDRPATWKVHGVITLDGQPVSDAIVSFIANDNQRPANGFTDSTGSYELTTFSRGDGAMEGTFRVTVVKYEKRAAKAATSNEEYVPAGPGRPNDRGPKNILPKQYADQINTPLTATVQSKRDNPISFDLAK